MYRICNSFKDQNDVTLSNAMIVIFQWQLTLLALLSSQGSKIVLVRSYLRVSQAAGQVNILIFLLKIKFSPCMPINFVMQGKCLFSDISRPASRFQNCDFVVSISQFFSIRLYRRVAIYRQVFQCKIINIFLHCTYPFKHLFWVLNLRRFF